MSTGQRSSSFSQYGGREEPSGRPLPISQKGLGQGKSTANYGNSSNSVVALTNSDRTTLSQIKARKRIALSSQKTSEEAPRRIFNYARGAEEEEADEEKGY